MCRGRERRGDEDDVYGDLYWEVRAVRGERRGDEEGCMCRGR